MLSRFLARLTLAKVAPPKEGKIIGCLTGCNKPDTRVSRSLEEIPGSGTYMGVKFHLRS